VKKLAIAIYKKHQSIKQTNFAFVFFFLHAHEPNKKLFLLFFQIMIALVFAKEIELSANSDMLMIFFLLREKKSINSKLKL